MKAWSDLDFSVIILIKFLSISLSFWKKNYLPFLWEHYFSLFKTVKTRFPYTQKKAVLIRFSVISELLKSVGIQRSLPYLISSFKLERLFPFWNCYLLWLFYITLPWFFSSFSGRSQKCIKFSKIGTRSTNLIIFFHFEWCYHTPNCKHQKF